MKIINGVCRLEHGGIERGIYRRCDRVFGYLLQLRQ